MEAAVSKRWGEKKTNPKHWGFLDYYPSGMRREMSVSDAELREEVRDVRNEEREDTDSLFGPRPKRKSGPDRNWTETGRSHFVGPTVSVRSG